MSYERIRDALEELRPKLPEGSDDRSLALQIRKSLQKEYDQSPTSHTAALLSGRHSPHLSPEAREAQAQEALDHWVREGKELLKRYGVEIEDEPD